MDKEKYLMAQVHALDKAIYLASEKAKRNLRFDKDGKLTDEYYIHWINENAPDFRNAWGTSLCKDCKKILSCYDCLKEKCDKFEQ